MRFYQGTTTYFCGLDLHSRNMYACIVDREGNILLHRSFKARPEQLLRAIEPYRTDITVAVECTYPWYWVADLCHEHKIDFALGHALYMKAIHGAKVKNDRIDSLKIARLTAGGLLPMAYDYPRKHRATRDLLRRRLRFVRQRADLYTHIHHLATQAQVEPIGNDAKSKTRRAKLPARFTDPEVRMNVEANLATIDHLDRLIAGIEKHILQKARGEQRKELAILQSIPGVGLIIALTILYEIDRMQRFDTRQQFASYARLVKCSHDSDGKKYGFGGAKMGNPYLKWAFSEAAVFVTQWCAEVALYHDKLVRKYGKGKARSLLAHKLGRAAYHMLRRGQVFDVARFLNQPSQQKPKRAPRRTTTPFRDKVNRKGTDMPHKKKD
jgi:transposase